MRTRIIAQKDECPSGYQRGADVYIEALPVAEHKSLNDFNVAIKCR